MTICGPGIVEAQFSHGPDTNQSTLTQDKYFGKDDS